jgi:hypothetical protein
MLRKWLAGLLVAALLFAPVVAWAYSCAARGERLTLVVESIIENGSPVPFDEQAMFHIEALYENSRLLNGLLYTPGSTSTSSYRGFVREE